MELTGSGDLGPVFSPVHLSPHAGQHVHEAQVALQRPPAEPPNPNPAPGEHRSGEEVRRGRRVGLDGDLVRPVGGRCDREPAVPVVDHVGPERRHRLDREVDVGLGHELVGQLDLHTSLGEGRGEQHRGEELARNRPGELDRAAEQTAASHLDREMIAGNARTESSQRRHERCDGAPPKLLVTVDRVRTRSERGECDHEPPGRPRLSGVDGTGPDGEPLPPSEDLRCRACRLGPDTDPERLERTHHGDGVVGEEHTAKRRPAVGQRSAHEGAVGVALRAGDRDDRVGRSGQRLDADRR